MQRSTDGNVDLKEGYALQQEQTVQPKVSIVIPIYNKEDILRKTLSSAVNQTLRDIEIICVDDHSHDRSRSILREFEKKDSRIKIVYHRENMSTSQSRKDGVLLSTGKYIMFLDGDDELLPHACETAYNAIEKHKTDMVHFGSNVVNCANMPQGRIDSNQRAVAPYLKRIEEDNLIGVCWEEKLFRFQLWNKIYKGDLCRRAFTLIEDGSFPKAQDLYAFFIIAYLSTSYIGVEDCLYNYNFGLGVTGGNKISLETFETLLTEKSVWDALCRFSIKQGAYDELKSVLDNIRYSFLNECVSRWMDNLEPAFMKEGFDLLTDLWGYGDVICLLAEKHWYNRTMIAERLLPQNCFQHRKRRKKKRLTVAYYYFTISNGGAQRVAAELCNIWASMKRADGSDLYDVVLITDTKALADDYALDSRVKRAFLPANTVFIREKYKERCQVWQTILQEFEIDIVVSGAWVAPCTLWDMLTVKGYSTKPAFVIHDHSFTPLPYRFENGTALEQTVYYRFCDGVVVLSECDKAYVGTFCPHTEYIVNPIGYLTETLETSAYEEHVLVWIGRISHEKSPLDLIYMMRGVIKSIPDAVLYIVGRGDEKLTEKLVTTAEELGLQEHVIFAGFTLDVGEYYKKASVFICTSEYEGFPMTLSEAMTYGVPVVMYDLPWLTFAKAQKGVFSVPQKRYDLLAAEAVHLLSDPEEVKKQGKIGQDFIRTLGAADIGKIWQNFFNAIPAKKTETEKSDEKILFEYIARYQQRSKDALQNEKNKNRKLTTEKSALNSKLQTTYKEKSELNAKLQKTYAEKSELNAKLKKTYEEKTELNAKLKKTYAEKSELNAKLQKTYAEKSEINAKLKQAYADKTERGLKIKELEARIAELERSLPGERTYISWGGYNYFKDNHEKLKNKINITHVYAKKETVQVSGYEIIDRDEILKLPHPFVIISQALEGDIAAAVKWLTQKKIPFTHLSFLLEPAEIDVRYIKALGGTFTDADHNTFTVSKNAQGRIRIHLHGASNASIQIGAADVSGTLDISVTGKNSTVMIGDGSSFEKTDIVVRTEGTVKIGQDCRFAQDVQVIQEQECMIFDMLTGEIIDGPESIIIGDRVQIGREANLLGGTDIGADSIVESYAVCADKFPEHAVITGNFAEAVH